jgi:hypothetical protein
MNKPLVASLLVAWCIFVVAPGWIVYLVFRGTDEDTAVVGPAFAIWIVGYLIQFGLFMALSRKSKGNSIVGWLLASTMPFAVDWTVPVAPWSPAAVAFVVGAYAVWFYYSLARSDDLQHNGIRAIGTVLEVKQPIMNMVINSVYIRRTMTLRIERADGAPPYEARYSGTFMLGEIPGPGAVFTLRVDPKNPRHFETVDERTANVRFSARPPTGAPRSAPHNDPTMADQLQQLYDMHRRGALTDDEFAAAKRRVLRN